MKTFFKPKEACKLLKINSNTLRVWEKAGKVECVRTPGGQRRVPSEEIARILNCPIEDLSQTLSQPDNDTDEIRKKKREVKSLQLELKKEKTLHAISQVTTKDKDAVQQAQDELIMLQIRQEKERILASQKKADAKRKAEAYRKVWVSVWCKWGYERFTYDPFESLAVDDYEPEPEPSLDWKVRLEKTIKETLQDTDISSNPKEVALLVKKVVDDLRGEYDEIFLYPAYKKKLIDEVISGLRFPWDTGEETIQIITHKIQDLLQSKLTGREETPNEAVDLAKNIKDQALKWLRERKEEDLITSFQAFSNMLKGITDRGD